MIVRFKKLSPKAATPQYAKPGDAGVDLTAVDRKETRESVTYNTGLAVEIPEGYLGLLMPRSSNVKKPLILGNSVGLIDSGFRGELAFVYKKTEDKKVSTDIYNIGDRVGQLVILPFPVITYLEAEELSETERGSGGYGSTGK